jgi:CheY-like chemotaxis protein
MTHEDQIAPGRVLVVEDDESTALFVTRVLQRGGLDAAWVSDAEQASALLADNSFDVLLADYRLPGTDGAELVRSTRQLLPEIATAVMTSFKDADVERAARSSGADDFFEKPLHPSSLISRISELVLKARASGPRTPGASSARGAEVSPPAMHAQEAQPSVGVSCAPLHAENGPTTQPPPRGRGVARGTTDRAGGAQTSWREGTGGVGWARFSAWPDSEESDNFGCEGAATEEVPPEGPGGMPPGLFERAPRLTSSRPRTRSSMLLWGSTAPDISIGSGVAPVTRMRTTPTSTFFLR